MSGRDGSESPRVAPHNLQAEEHLIGAMLLARDAIAAASEVVRPADFYKPAHVHIYDAILGLYGSGEPVDPVTVADELMRSGTLEAIGGPSTLIGLQANAPAMSSAGRYAHIIEELALLRRMISAAGEIAELGYSMPDDVEKAVDSAEAMIFDLAHHRHAGELSTLRSLLERNLDIMERRFEDGDTLTGVPTGYLDLDELLSGLQKGALYVVGARPGVGKSSFALGAADHVALVARKPALFFTLEMSEDELAQRILASEARVDAKRVRDGVSLREEDWEKIGHTVGRLGEAPVFIYDNPNLTVMEIRSKARKLKAQVGEIGVIVVDYLQLMGGRAGAENRQVEVGEISRSLKILAREIETPIVALSQLNRGLEQRADKRPMLSDLRESGCLPAETLIARADNGQEVTIGELVLSQDQPLVWSVDDHQRLIPARLTKTFPSGIKPVFRLTLASGRSVEATANHPFLTVEGWRRLDELAVGGFVGTPRRLPAPLVTDPTFADDELVLLAHMLGDGHMGNSYKYATADPANKVAVEDAARRLFGIDAEGDRRGVTWQLWFPSPYKLTHGIHHPMRNWLEPLGLQGKRAWDKFIPQGIFGLPNDKVALFLRHLWATDGSITISRNRRGPVVNTYYATTSQRLALDVQRLLLRFEIRSTIGSGKKERADGGTYRTGYSVRISGAANQAKFLRTVGCHGQRGECIPDALVILDAFKDNPNLDLVPWGVIGVVREALADGNISQRQLADHLAERYCGSYFLGSETRPRRFSRDRLRRMGERAASQRLIDVATSDLYWDEVVSIEPLGDKPTFDATIEGTHNFLADGIVVHNSLEQDADVVIFLYRDELYDKESTEEGICEVIVAKHRGGPTGTVRLAFLGQYTRFANMAKNV